jgi:putative transcriptional regulator
MRILSLWFVAALLTSAWPTMLRAQEHGGGPDVPPDAAILLVASEQMTDPRFRGTVLVVTGHGNTGPIGVVINRPTGIALDELFPEHSTASGFHLFYGGPAYPKQLCYLIRGAGAVKGALLVSGATYLALDQGFLGEILDGRRHYTGLRVMQGIASWAPGQLEYEIKSGRWFVLPMDESAIFDFPPERLWQHLRDRAVRAQEF